MSAQTEMFPKTELDQAHAILNHLLNEREKASQAIDNAEKKHAEASDRVYKQQRVIEWLQAKMPAADATVESEATEEPVEDAVVVDESHQIEGDVIDPITGEVTTPEPRETPPDPATCATCGCAGDCAVKLSEEAGAEEMTGCGGHGWVPKPADETDAGDDETIETPGATPEPSDETDGPIDELFASAVDLVVATGAASLALLQRRLGIGFGRAAEILNQLEVAGIVGPPDGHGSARTVLVDAAGAVEALAKLRAAA